MKRKNIEKLSKILFAQLNEQKELKIKKSKALNYAIDTPTAESSPFDLCEYDFAVSERFKKLVTNLINYPNNLRFDYNNNFITITIDNIKDLKKTIVSNPSAVKSAYDSNCLKIEINKVAFEVAQGYEKRTRYKDPDMYAHFIETIKDKVKEINGNNFNDIYNLIAKESGIIRDSNLDDVFNHEED
jgi:hypothetical protein